MTQVGLGNHVLEGGADPPNGRSNFGGKVTANCKQKLSMQRTRSDASSCVSQSQARSALLKIARTRLSSPKYRHCADTFIMLKQFKRNAYRLQTIEDLMRPLVKLL